MTPFTAACAVIYLIAMAGGLLYLAHRGRLAMTEDEAADAKRRFCAQQHAHAEREARRLM